MSAFWTDQRFTKLRRLHKLGYCASDIAEKIGNGCTRNMVIGKRWREAIGERRAEQMRKLRLIRHRELTFRNSYRRKLANASAPA